ncbi:MAG: 4-hydroxy-tetrahydrodipicolinate reductase, partial [Nitrospirae bacterium]
SSFRETGVPISDNIEDITDDVDVIIDFTTPVATMNFLKRAHEVGVPIVIGTTGLGSKERDEILKATETIPCVLAPNMSVGINLLLNILQKVAETVGDDYDIEIVEAHHRLKKDAPSGTALKMAEVIADTLGRDLNKVGVYARKGNIGERSKTEIGIQTIRAGDIVGEHTVIFASYGERIEFTHRASNRDTFARGAIRAAEWVYGKSPGLYDMMDVLGLKWI